MSPTPEIIAQVIEYDFFNSRFGECLIARSNDGICRLEFVGRAREHVLRRLAKVHHNARLRKRTGELAVLAEAAFEPMTAGRPRVHLHGTVFQTDVWNTLLEIPPGTTASYRSVAERIGRPQAARAVARAIAANCVAYLVPCHRVVLSNGDLGGYRWGVERKAAMLNWEKARFQRQDAGPPAQRDKETIYGHLDPISV